MGLNLDPDLGLLPFLAAKASRGTGGRLVTSVDGRAIITHLPIVKGMSNDPDYCSLFDVHKPVEHQFQKLFEYYV